MNFLGFDINASALTAQRLRMDVIASNIANVNTTRTPEGGPYRRKMVVFQEQLKDSIASMPFSSGENVLGGVKVSQIVQSNESPLITYQPGHPDADENGYVAMPNVNIVHEMTDMISATRAYEANLMTMSLGKSMYTRTLDIMRI
ncbi:MAG: flagellar basal body rod protein FlgC [Candidatus Omnitrophica bacterium]|nr:flagellar basal body rod protein FlgC [Candidatus Omnitrophota bacterium]